MRNKLTVNRTINRFAALDCTLGFFDKCVKGSQVDLETRTLADNATPQALR